MDNKIQIKKKNLIFREEAQRIIKEIKRKHFKKCFLDFSRVLFISRSFADELLTRIDNSKKENFEIKILNLNPDLSKFFSKIKETKANIKKILSFSANLPKD